MKLRITYRKHGDVFEISVDTDNNSDVLYSKTYKSEESALEAIEIILKASKIDIKTIEPPIEFKDEFGSFIFDSDADFTNDIDYMEFCKSMVLQETN